MCSWIPFQTLVLLLSHMLGPLQDRNMLQESSSKFRLLYPTLNPIWAILKGADNTAVYSDNNTGRREEMNTDICWLDWSL
ncbi:hypothetical protein GOODEAATRI_019991 [Goodea atripinnis]|uniref:Secreted protein n=1 Tax=Goodea atripinnis TaxID=208336 RepID=A0ABV0MJF3_9TELE